MTDKRYQTAVVRVDEVGDLKVLCFTDYGEPAIYADCGHAERYATVLRDRHPGYVFRTIDFVVL